jgi:thioredoxin reductase (NADPH)
VKVIVIGDGPAGLSAALFLAKTGNEVVVYAQDGTAMHWADLHNYLGVPHIGGSEFQRIARDQATGHGAVLRDAEVSRVSSDDGGFTATTADGDTDRADYLVLAAGKPGQALADQLGLDRTVDGVAVDREYRATKDRVYAVGRLARPNRSQAIISAGAGATAALDILAREAGGDVTDWDTPSDG